MLSFQTKVMKCNVLEERATIRVLFTLYVNNKLGHQ